MIFDRKHAIYHNKTSDKFRIEIAYYIFGWCYSTSWMPTTGKSGDMEFTSGEDAERHIAKIVNYDEWVKWIKVTI